MKIDQKLEKVTGTQSSININSSSQYTTLNLTNGNVYMPPSLKEPRAPIKVPMSLR